MGDSSLLVFRLVARVRCLQLVEFGNNGLRCLPERGGGTGCPVRDAFSALPDVAANCCSAEASTRRKSTPHIPPILQAKPAAAMMANCPCLSSQQKNSTVLLWPESCLAHHPTTSTSLKKPCHFIARGYTALARHSIKPQWSTEMTSNTLVRSCYCSRKSNSKAPIAITCL